MKNVFKKISDKKGVISIIYIILIFIATIVILGFIGITNKAMSINEIQGIMDNAGVIALRRSVNETKWRVEELEVNESMARNEFIKLIHEYLDAGKGKLLKSYHIDRNDVRIYPPNHPRIRSLGISSNIKGPRDQYFLEATMTATFPVESIVDLVSYHAVSFFDFLNTNDYATVMVSGRNEDGEMEVIVRTVSRLVLR